MGKFWESGPIIVFVKVSKNYFSQVYGHKFGQNVINGGQFDQNRSFWMKMVQNWVILGQNGATGQNLGKMVEYFFSKSFYKLF